MKKVEVLGLETIPQIKQGDDLAQIIVDSAAAEIGGLKDLDIIVITSKVVSKAHGLTVKLSEIVPGKEALALSKRTGKDARLLQIMLDRGHKILAVIPLKGVIARYILKASPDAGVAEEALGASPVVCVTKGSSGLIHTADGGIDGSNHPPGVVSFLPDDPDKAANKITEQIHRLTGKTVPVILTDTEMITFGTIDKAVGSSGIAPRAKTFGKSDAFGKPKFGGMDMIVHELSAACALVFGQTTAGIPAAVVRGLTGPNC